MATPNPLPSAEYLKQCFYYLPQLGILMWLRRPRHHFDTDHVWKVWNTRYAGTLAGWKDSKGYLNIMLNDVQCKVHRIAWKLMTGEDSGETIDHKDCDKQNNRWRNLREATQSQQKMNRGIQANNTTGFRGVCFNGAGYQTQIQHEGRCRHLGIYDTPEEAHEVYCRHAQKLHGEFFNSNTVR